MSKSGDEHNTSATVHNAKNVMNDRCSLSRQILAILNDNPKMQYNSIAIAQIIHGHSRIRDEKLINKIRTELHRLEKRQRIRYMKRGFFQAKPSLQHIQKIESSETKLHGIKIECTRILGISAERNIESWLEDKYFEPVNNDSGTWLRRWTRNSFWEERYVTFTVHENLFVEVFVNCSKNPLSYPEFQRFCEFLNGFFDPFYFNRSDMFLVQVGVGKDFNELELDGVKSVRLHKFANDWATIYMKDDGRVRFEHHLKLHLNLDDALNMLDILTTPIPVYGNGHREDDRRDVT